MSHDRGTSPSDWPGLEMADMTQLTDCVYFGWLAEHTNPVFWHWCAALADAPEEHLTTGQWVAANTEAHTLVAREPLHLEPSLLWRCCGLHGFVREGRWVSA